MQPTKVRDAHQKFIEFLKGKKHSSATILAYGKDIEQLASFLEEMNKHHVADVTSEDLQAFLAKMANNGTRDRLDSGLGGFPVFGDLSKAVSRQRRAGRLRLPIGPWCGRQRGAHDHRTATPVDGAQRTLRMG